jgi:hypothetical protein
MRDALYEVKDGPLRIDATRNLPTPNRQKNWEIVDLDRGGPDSAEVPMDDTAFWYNVDDDVATVVPQTESIGPLMEELRLEHPHLTAV